MNKRIFQVIGAIGTIALSILFFRHPTWPTPDKIVFFLTFVFMCFSQALEMLKRLLPFVIMLAVYESFRGIADKLNSHVNFTFMPRFDKWLFGSLPTSTLQRWWWHGHVQWYDMVFYIVYMLHFILPISLVLLVWKYREKFYWRVVSTYVVLSFAGFLTYMLFPAAPPWMASDRHIIQPVTHISFFVFKSLGIQDFPSIYDKINPNPVAAVPSLHAAYAVLFCMFIYKFFGKKWGTISLVYPALIIVGTIYTAEHYAIDAILGIMYAIGAYYLTIWLFDHVWPKVKQHPSKTKVLSLVKKI